MYARYLLEWAQYKREPGAEPVIFRDSHPCLFDASDATPFDARYFFQAVWATERIAREKPTRHFDVGSDVMFVGLLTSHLPVVFVDIRPLTASCLHVAEHVGLGRYGDPLNPAGTRLACAELARVLASGGDLFFSVPVGRPRTCFNAHRIHSPGQVISSLRVWNS